MSNVYKAGAIHHLTMAVRKIFSNYNSQLFAHIVLGVIFFALGCFWLSTGYLPGHDVVEDYGLSHYFYSSVARGVIPYWNPYSQTGTSFFGYFQPGGFLTPLQFLCILLQILTGCTTLTIYIVHYLLMYYVFILGAYCTLRLITANNGVSLIFSLVLFLASFPVFMRQNIQMFFLIPFITFFLLLFLKESRFNRKGFYLFITGFFFVVSLHRWIPIFLLFYLLLLVIFVFLVKVADLKANMRFFTSKHGILWTGASIIVVLLISSPIIALYYELSHDTEYIPTLRFLQKNGRNLVKFYASDIGEKLFSEGFSDNIKVSTTLGNFIGVLFEPFQSVFGIAVSSEIVLYISILPLLCIAIALVKVRGRYSYLFFIIAGLTFLLSCNFKDQIFTEPSVPQHILLTLFPFLKMSDVLQNAGVFLLFCLIITGAIGFQNILEEKRKFPWLIPILFPLYKYTVFFPLLFSRELFVYQTILIFSFLFLVALVLVLRTGNVLINKLHRLNVKSFQYLAIVILFLDLLIFNVFHIVYLNQVLNDKYFTYLHRQNLANTKSEREFLNYRVPFSPAVPSQQFNSFFFHEIYNVEKAAFPGIVRLIRSKLSGENYFANWDHFYMTTYYYDYLVNVKYEKQVVTSHIISPILNFFPKENAIFVDSKYDVVEQLNTRSLSDLRKYIFIERDTVKNTSSFDVSQLFNPSNYVRYTKEELNNFDQSLHLQYSANEEVSLNIIDYDINNLSLSVETPYDGYVYFGDGYSKHWKAWLDGEQTKIEKTNMNFKSVYVPEGVHKVDFLFDPFLFRYSLYLYVIGNLMFLTLFIIKMVRNFRTGI